MPYLVDGNNLIGHSRELNMKDPHSRVRLVRQLAAFCRRRPTEATVVFDGAPDPLLPSLETRLGGLRVLFAGPGRDADSLIMEILAGVADPVGVIVVTSDRSLADRARYRRARVQRSHQFRQTLREMEIDESLSGEGRLTEQEVADWIAYFSRRGPASS